MRALPQVEFTLVLSIKGTYSIDMHTCYFTRIALTVVLLCYFQKAIILVAVMAILTVMARLVGFVSQIVARMVAHRYV